MNSCRTSGISRSGFAAGLTVTSFNAGPGRLASTATTLNSMCVMFWLSSARDVVSSVSNSSMIAPVECFVKGWGEWDSNPHL